MYTLFPNCRNENGLRKTDDNKNACGASRVSIEVNQGRTINPLMKSRYIFLAEIFISIASFNEITEYRTEENKNIVM